MKQKPQRRRARVHEDPLGWTIFRGFAWGAAFATGFALYLISWLPYVIY